MSWCFILYDLGHLVNHILPSFQFTSGLCLTNQLCPRNMSILFRSVTAASICFLYLLISTSSGAILVTSLFSVPSALNISKEKSTGFVWILLSLTNCSLISIWVHLEFTSASIHNSFLFLVLIFACIFSSFSLLFL